MITARSDRRPGSAARLVVRRALAHRRALVACAAVVGLGLAAAVVGDRAYAWVTADRRAPTGVARIDVSERQSSSVRLAWPAAADDVAVTLYRVERDGRPHGVTDRPGYLDTDVGPDDSFSYQVVALDGRGNASPPSPTVLVPPASPRPTAPRNFTAPEESTAALDPLFVSGSRLADVRTAVAAGREPQAAAAADLVERADALVAAAADTAPPSTCDSSHGCAFWSQRPYSSDGVYADERDRADYRAAGQVSQSVVVLGVAWQLTGDRRYAAVAHESLVTWMVDPQTAMAPLAWNFAVPESGYASQAIDIFVNIPGILYGASLVWDYDGMTADQKVAIQRWAGAIGQDALNRRQYDNNVDAWRVTLVTAAAVTARDPVLLDAAVAEFQRVAGDQLSEDGSFARELDRTRSLHYSLFAMHALLQTVQLAQVQGVDVAPQASPIDDRLVAALNRHAPYLADEDAWQAWQRDTGYEEIGPITDDDDLAALELGSWLWADALSPAVGQALESWGRPIVSPRGIGPVTLTHGRSEDRS